MNLIEYSLQTFSLIKEEILKGRECALNVATRSMAPLIKRASKVKIKKCSLDELFFGDICVYRKELDLIAHRYLYKKSLNGARYFLCKGDANVTPDKWISEDRLIGKLSSIERQCRILSLESRVGYIESLVMFLFSFFCNIFKSFLYSLKKILIWIVVSLGRFSCFKACFNLVYGMAVKAVVLVLTRNKDVAAVYLKGSFAEKMHIHGLSDIDFVVILTHIDSKNLEGINRGYLFLKRFVPFLGEMYIYEEGYKPRGLFGKLIHSRTKNTTGVERTGDADAADVLFKIVNKMSYYYLRLARSAIIYSSSPEGSLKAFRSALLAFKKFKGLASEGKNKRFSRYFDLTDKALKHGVEVIDTMPIYRYKHAHGALSKVYIDCLYYLEGLAQGLKQVFGKEFDDIVREVTGSLRYYDEGEIFFGSGFNFLKVDKILVNIGFYTEFYLKFNNIKVEKEAAYRNAESFLKMLNGRNYFLYTDNSIIMRLINSPESPFDIFRFCQCQEKAKFDSKLHGNRLWRKLHKELFINGWYHLVGKFSSLPSLTQRRLDRLIEEVYTDILALKLYREAGFIPFSFREALDRIGSYYKGSDFSREIDARFGKDSFDLKTREKALDAYFKNYLFMYDLLRAEKKAIDLMEKVD